MRASRLAGADHNAHARHPGVLAAQRRERARLRSERQQRWGRPKPKSRMTPDPVNVYGQRTRHRQPARPRLYARPRQGER